MNIQERCALGKMYLSCFPGLISGNKNPPHLAYTADLIQTALEKKTEKYQLLLVSEPPRHGKTELISKHLPPWFLGKNPTKRVILTSYGAELADTNSDLAKNIFERWNPVLFDVHPSKSMFKRSAWDTDSGGGVISAGIGGAITGFGADLFVIDDFVKDAEQAESSLVREKTWQWWQAVAATRLHPGAVIIIMATRWNHDDLIGRLLQQYKEEGDEFPFEVTYINFPAIAEENDPIGRKPGEALWKWRYPIGKLLDIKKIVGSYWWNALYMGSPTDRGGTLFKKKFFRYYERDLSTGDYLCYLSGLDEPVRVYKNNLIRKVYADPALEVKLKNDPSGGLAWAYDRQHKYWLLLDRLNDRIEHTEILKTYLNFAFRNNCSAIGVENEKIGKIILKQSAGNDRVGGVPIPFFEVKCGRLDKYARATPMASYTENERVFFPKNAPWLDDFENHIIKFPNRKEHDEDVDCYAYAQDLEDTMSVAEALSRRRM